MLLKSARLVAVAALIGGTCLSAIAAEPVKVDTSALRYYAAHNEIDRYEAELKRLQTLYPEWTPPADIGALDGPGPEAGLWTLYAADDLDGFDKALADLKAQDPAFALSNDLASKIAVKRDRRDLIAASNAGDAAKVVSLAEAHPDFGGCADLDVAWRLAEAHFAVAGKSAAFDDYHTLLSTCDDSAGRLATMQKALALLGPDARPLTALGRTNPDGTGEFAGLEIDFVRADIAAVLKDASAAKPDPALLASFADRTLANGPGADAGLLGWYRRLEGDHAGALKAFEIAATLGQAEGTSETDLAKTAEGIVLSLDALGRRDEAVARARDGRDKSQALAKLYVDLGTARFEGDPRPRLPDAELADYAKSVVETKSAAGAEALGWYAYDFHQYNTAADWFRFAQDTEASEARARGLILAEIGTGDLASAKATKAKWLGDFADLADLTIAAPSSKSGGGKARTDALVTRFERHDYRGCIAIADQRIARSGTLPADASLMHGWCLMKMQRPNEAASAFAIAARGSGQVRKDALYGRSLALMAAGEMRGAAEVAASGEMTGKRRNEIGTALLSNQAVAAFNGKRWTEALRLLDARPQHAGETRDLAMMRGWSLWHLGRKSEAAKVFVALDQTLSTPETRSALATVRRPLLTK
ncbi:hypothetical protein HDIA_4546 [Hartmannibacter diazotrophicus]|uniref:Uncharacterized protein n=1 Tax=Hartmannibacter diazotrophicus TaxID=1482074 RepID=A0A2C9DCR1_9HYPH|nr:hypothetical protein [Hartmannibacter diazotrophicus]SON58087.1 hypothetical protein HDIA_4546 [Hartmannibacter diazotrophicus]